jgi:nitrite reductase/ring-hydroxylating ferredoxin subunit
VTTDPVRVGPADELREKGRLTGKVGRLPVLVVWHEDRPYAIEDRCPHMGFPLHQGTVEAGLLTCHWHHARFDLVSGCTLDPFADDAQAFDVQIDGADVLVSARPAGDPIERYRRRLRDGLEQGFTLVIAKAVMGLLEAEDGRPETALRTALDFGVTYRRDGWGSGLTVLVAMANLLPLLEPEDRPLALVHALRFVARDTAGQPPRFAEPALAGAAAEVPAERLAGWYRRFVDTRSADSAERALATAVTSGDLAATESMMFAAVTDHVFIDEGHALDFTNKAFEALALVGTESALALLPSLVAQACAAERAEETSDWRHPHDLASLAARYEIELVEALAAGGGAGLADSDVSALGWALLAEEPYAVVTALVDAARLGASAEQLGRAVAYAAALRLVRFHVQNDHGDWNTVHHAFTTANALHQALVRQPTPELARGIVHSALRVYLDRFLNVPAARLPQATAGDLAELGECWDVQGQVDRAGAVVAGSLRAGGSREAVVAALGKALLAEDAGFHWYQIVEAGARQALAWPAGSEESTLVLVGVARFLAAHTPSRRELPTVVQIAARLRRGEALYDDPDAA